MINIELHSLQIFVAVVKQESFVRAADELDIAASVVSRSIQKLEKSLQVRLFNRTTRKINLTQEGEWLFSQAREIMQRTLTIENHFNQLSQQPQGILRIDAATPFTLHAIAPLMAGFKQRYPALSVVLTSSEANVDLIAKNVDVTVRIGQLSDSSLRARKLGECYRKIYASPQYLARHGPIEKVVDLDRQVCLGFAKPEKLNVWPLRSNDEIKGYKIKPQFIADSGETLKQLAIQGSGVVCLSSFTVRKEVAQGELVPILDKQLVKIAIPVYAVFYSDTEMNNRLRCLLDYLVQYIDFQG